jgi:G3E family GTPase
MLTGFFGNGKTTLLAGMLAIPGVKDTAIIVNEFDAVGLDRLLLEPQIRRSWRHPSGCACCASRRNAIPSTLLAGEGRSAARSAT